MGQLLIAIIISKKRELVLFINYVIIVDFSTISIQNFYIIVWFLLHVIFYHHEIWFRLIDRP